MQDQRAEVDWRDGTGLAAVPVSRRFDDPYYSLDDGLAETRHVFLAGNDLPARFRDGFHIAELGFGTGLNFLAALAAFRAADVPGRLIYTGFEAWPMTRADRARALAPFAELPGDLLLNAPERAADLVAEDVTLRLIVGDARATLPAWDGVVDAWFLDGFSPEKNPEMWESDLMAQVASHMAPGATLASYTAAGHVRRALAAAGLEVTRRDGFGRKRHMTTARKP